MSVRMSAFALFCFLTGIVSCYATIKLIGDSQTISVPTTVGQLTAPASATPAIGHSPFSVVTDRGGVSLPQVTKPAKSLLLNSDKLNNPIVEINYHRLYDYNYLLSTLTTISNTGKLQLWLWIDTASVLSNLSSITRSIHQAMFQRLSELEPKAVVDWIVQRSKNISNNNSDVLLEDAIAGFTQAQPKAAENLLAGLEQYGQRQAAKSGLLKAIGRINPERILGQLASYTNHSVVNEIVSEWAKRDLSAAHYWLMNRATGDEKSMYEFVIVEELMKQDTNAALAYLKQSSEEGHNAWAISQYGPMLAQHDPQAALDWALENEDAEVVEQTMIELAWSWPDNDLATMHMRIESIDDTALRERIILATSSRILDQFAQNDSMSAMAWIDTLSISMQAEIRPQAIARWFQNEPSNP